MSSVAFVPGDAEPRPHVRPLNLRLLAGGAEPPDRGLPSSLVFRKGVREMLMQCPPSIRPLVVDSCEEISKWFGKGVKMALERFIDPDEMAPEAILYLVIGTELAAREARDALDRFQDEWWLDNVDRGQDKIHISLEFL